MKGLAPLPRVFVILTQAFVLATCGTEHPKVELGALATRSTINVTTRVSDTRKVTSTVYTRSEGAVVGAAEGASGALEGAMSSADPWALPLGILLIPLFATVGGATGAASGTSNSREEIIMALTTINQAYVPKKFERIAERQITANLERNLFGENGPCFSTRQTRSNCPQKATASKLNISMAFNLVPARSGAGAGNVDYLGKITLDAQPDGVLRPECVSFIFRQFAGNIFELAKNNGAELNRSFSLMIGDLARQLPYALVSKSGTFEAKPADASNRSSPRPQTSTTIASRWARVSCASWELALQ